MIGGRGGEVTARRFPSAFGEGCTGVPGRSGVTLAGSGGGDGAGGGGI